MGTHIDGCDICQAVCPYNLPPPISHDAPWQPRPGLDRPTLAELWRRSDAELQSLRRGSAMSRAKLPGLRRTLAVAIGNSGDPDAIAALSERSDDRPSADDEMVQQHVAWALRSA